ncbi:excinuclease ABC subunit A [Candidatus Falkowbacteria bacterium RIFOXYB2_FULL_47_14]|uniref:UvrABC system protein A n=1 Tax=Candidatus Falkowbacteria bacterium RIFOXYA2_FULL_47_19 TaxID=1797994 RepID=A0A1F5SLY1_9BACT|nr:MAG: excinuclease ABC subunit A [Candidatus Falkowbacteria bacterium RIFOXYA2_FULL_47_19]OGF37334.1 MAG: excinuclease ABC subunit A [Candidatus Falkowbacteria bacterium RIFOXYC2_FULL_46_15]OGF42836.1 MAG: excinuclease ABC subunit A [Candidatus Falkowbacteria bacterium RIFOXYB2_FULL_47_14]
MPKTNSNTIKIKGARVHNLKNVSLEIPRDKYVVFTGLSGSGKSSLAFDTIYAEGQRRYVESLSAYARQFIGLMDKPDVDSIEGLSPAISIDQKTAPHNPRSTVGTITEIYDYMRLLFARVGIPHCPECGRKIKQYTVDEIVNQISAEYADKETTILSPVIKDKKGEHKNTLPGIKKAGYGQVRFDNKTYALDEFEDMTVNKKLKHNLEIVIDRLKISKNKEDMARLSEAIESALDLSNGLVTVLGGDNSGKKEDAKTFSRLFACPDCGISLPELEPRNFSFNSPHGACEECSGLGTKLEIDSELILNPNLTIAQGAIRPWAHNTATGQTWLMRILGTVANKNGFDLNTPLKNLTKKQMDIVLYGTGDKNYNVDYESERFSGELTTEFEGVIPNLERRYGATESDYVRKEIEQYMRVLVCPKCGGQRLKKEMLSVKVAELSISDIATMTIESTKEFFTGLENSKTLTVREKKIASQIIKEIKARLEFLLNVGLNYLTLDRSANTLSGGEAQRIRLANQIGTSLVGVLYILDEPSIGLHQRDNNKLIDTLKKLRDIGNTVIVVEHDEATMEAADWIVDVGPGAGEHGGKIVVSGTPAKIKNTAASLTGQYLSGKKSIPIPKKYRPGNGQAIRILGASEHNLKNIDVSFPLGKFIAITGVSGSGKSTLMTDILARALNQKFYRAKTEPGKHKSIEGLRQINKVINIDQSPIGRTPRSNPATYTGAFTPIRELFASLPESKIKGYKAGRFSFNVVGGRCEACAGDGMVKIEMQFLPDVYVECEVCHGHRYNKEALDIYYKDKNISEVLNMTVEEAMTFFKNIPAIFQKLDTLNEVGLGYIKLGQSATTLSGGEAQRIKLATELSRRATGQTLYILDEPTTGLHFDDIKRLLDVLNQLVDKGNTVLIIEHNLDVIKSVDWVIDLGPEGGDKGGYIVAEGTPKDIAKVKNSYTGQYLSKVLK